MCQLSLPAEYSIGPQILAPTKLKKTKAVTFKPNPKGLHKMQYTSVIILGFLNAFALAVPISMFRRISLEYSMERNPTYTHRQIKYDLQFPLKPKQQSPTVSLPVKLV